MGYGNDAVLDGIDRTGPSTLFDQALTGKTMNLGGPDVGLARVGRRCAVLPTVSSHTHGPRLGASIDRAERIPRNGRRRRWVRLGVLPKLLKPRY
jgi:hypothetical protein